MGRPKKIKPENIEVMNEATIRPANFDPISLKNSVIGNGDGRLEDKMRSVADLGNYQVAAAYSVIYTKVERFRKDVIIEVEKLRDFYLTDVMINQFTDDALAPDIVSNEILTIYSENEDINKELERLQEQIDFDELAISICPDMLLYGEYTIGIQAEDGKGIIDITDTVQQDKVLPLDKNGQIEGFLVQSNGKLSVKLPSEYAKFSLSSKKIRVDLFSEFSGMKGQENKEAFKNVPRYIRIGKSLLYPVRAKIKELELLEQLVPATKLSKLASGTVVGVSVPSGYSIEQANEVAKKVEGILNKKIGVDTEKGQITLENIMSSAGRLKVVPIFGDKGTLQKFDYKQDEPDELLASVEDIRKVICNSIGIPYELIFQNETVSKGEILRRYARYVRKLKSIQRSIADGLRQIVYIHLSNKGFSYTSNDIKIDFKNKLVEIDNLNKLEFLDTTISMLKNARDFINELNDNASPYKPYLNITVFKDFINEQLGLVGLRGLISDEPIVAPPAPVTPEPKAIEATKEETPPADTGTEPDVVDIEDLQKQMETPNEV